MLIELGADSAQASAPRELFPLPVFDNGLDAPYDVAPDGQRLLVRAAPQTASRAAADRDRQLAGAVEKSSGGAMTDQPAPPFR